VTRDRVYTFNWTGKEKMDRRAEWGGNCMGNGLRLHWAFSVRLFGGKQRSRIKRYC